MKNKHFSAAKVLNTITLFIGLWIYLEMLKHINGGPGSELDLAAFALLIGLIGLEIEIFVQRIFRKRLYLWAIAPFIYMVIAALGLAGILPRNIGFQITVIPILGKALVNWLDILFFIMFVPAGLSLYMKPLLLKGSKFKNTDVSDSDTESASSETEPTVEELAAHEQQNSMNQASQ